MAAPGKIERPARDELKTDQRDAERVLRLLMIDELHAVRLPTVEEDAIRDPVRASKDLRSVIHNVRRTVVRLPRAAPGAVATDPELHNDTSWPDRGDRERKTSPKGGAVMEIRTQVRLWARRLLLAGTVATASLGTFAAPAGAKGPATAGGPDHIFYIMMENHAYDQIIGNTADAPFINQLAAQNRLASNFHGVTHPSMPNYLSAISGYFQGIWDDCKAGADVFCAPEEFVPNSGDGTSNTLLTQAQIDSASNTAHLFSAQNIVDQLEAEGISWKAYMENLPSPGSEVEYAPTLSDGTVVKLYAQKHNPFMYFSDINSPGNPRLNQIVAYESNFSADLRNGTVPNFSFISPNQCHDMHGISPSTAALVGLPSCGFPDSGLDHGAIQLGDQWLQQTVTAIRKSSAWKKGKSEIIIPWDENDYSTDTTGGPFSPTGQDGAVLGGGPAPLIVVSNHGKSGFVNNTLLDHYTTLYAIERMWHLGCLAYTCNVTNGNQFMSLFR